MCIYGASGVGKTTLVKTLKGPALILNAESGLSVLSGTAIDYISIAHNDKGDLLGYAERATRLNDFMRFVQTPEARKKYEYIFVDSLTECGEVVLKGLEAQKLEGWDKWGQYKSDMLDFLKFFRDARHYNVIFTALEDRRDEDAQSCYAPNIGGKSVKETLLSLFDECYRMVIIEDKRTLVTQGTPKTQAKTRCKHIGKTEPADLGRLFEEYKKG